MAYEKVSKIVCYDCVNLHHLVAACPKCDTGVVVATCPEDYNGIAESLCNDCFAAIAFYVVIKKSAKLGFYQSLWRWWTLVKERQAALQKRRLLINKPHLEDIFDYYQPRLS